MYTYTIQYTYTNIHTHNTIISYLTYRSIPSQVGDVNAVEVNVVVLSGEVAGGVVSQEETLTHHHHHHVQPRPPGGGLHTAGLPSSQGGIFQEFPQENPGEKRKKEKYIKYFPCLGLRAAEPEVSTMITLRASWLNKSSHGNLVRKLI